MAIFKKLSNLLRMLNTYRNNFLQTSSHLEKTKIVFNTSWLFTEKFLRMGVSFLISAWVVRYLGPHDYGVLSYCLVFNSFFEPILQLGLPIVVSKYLLKDPEQKKLILGTSCFLFFLGGILSLISIILISNIFYQYDKLLQKMILLLSLGYLFRFFDIIEVWFDSQLQSKYIVKVKAITLLLAGLTRIVMINMNLKLIYFIIPIILEPIITMIGFLFYYQSLQKDLFKWYFDIKFAKKMVFESWPIIFSNLTVLISAKIDQIILNHTFNPKILGIYSAAIKLSELWYFIPSSIAVSIFPLLLQSHKRSLTDFNEKMAKLFEIMTWTFIFLGIPFFIMSGPIILFLFKEQFLESIPIFQILLLSGIFIFWNSLQRIWEVANSKLKLTFFRTLAGSILSICLNFYMIPRFGAMGAAYATILTLGISNSLIFLIFKDSREIFFFQMKSFIPVRLGKEVKSIFKAFQEGKIS